MIKDYFQLAFRNIQKRGIRSWLTMIGIFIGIAAVVSLMGLGEGLRDAISSQFGFLGTDYMTVTATGGFGPPGTGVVNPLDDETLEKIKNVPGVEGAAGRILESVAINYNKKTSIGYAVSMPDGEDRKLVEDAINMKAETGRLLKDGDKDVVFLGIDFMKEDNDFEKEVLPGDKIKIHDREFEVVGIMEKKGNFQIDQAVLFNEDVLRELIERPDDEHDLIAVKIKEGGDIEKIKSDIEKEMRKARNVDEGEEDFSVSTPQQTLEGVDNVLLGVQIFIAIIAGISLLVGGIGIMNTMYTSVVERTKEIGVMKAIGARNKAIFFLFFIESGLLGSVGGIVGALMGWGIAHGLAYAGQLIIGSDLISAHVSLTLMGGAILFSFILGSVFGTVPALQASKLNPVDALRKTK